MAHTVIGDKVVVEWKTGDPEGDRLTLLAAYLDFVKEIKAIAIADRVIVSELIIECFDKWNIDTEYQIDDVPRIWIKRPEK